MYVQRLTAELNVYHVYVSFARKNSSTIRAMKRCHCWGNSVLKFNCILYLTVFFIQMLSVSFYSAAMDIQIARCIFIFIKKSSRNVQHSKSMFCSLFHSASSGCRIVVCIVWKNKWRKSIPLINQPQKNTTVRDTYHKEKKNRWWI